MFKKINVPDPKFPTMRKCLFWVKHLVRNETSLLAKSVRLFSQDNLSGSCREERKLNKHKSTN